MYRPGTRASRGIMAETQAIAGWLNITYGVLAAVLLVRLGKEGLARRYRCFAFFLAADIVATAALSLVPYRSDLYAWIWIAAQPLSAVWSFLVVLELYRLVLRDYPESQDCLAG